MKKTLSSAILVLLITVISYAQEFNNNNIIGNWRIIKSDLYFNKNIVKSAYLDNKNNHNDTILTGGNMGSIDDKINMMVKSMLGTIMKFDSKSSFSWDNKLIDFGMINKYWIWLNNSNEIKVCEWKDKDKLIPLIMQFNVLNIENEKLVLVSEDSEMLFRFDLIKIK